MRKKVAGNLILCGNKRKIDLSRFKIGDLAGWVRFDPPPSLRTECVAALQNRGQGGVQENFRKFKMCKINI